MKTLALDRLLAALVLSLALVLPISGCEDPPADPTEPTPEAESQSGPAEADTASSAELREVTLAVEGMTCEGCVNAVSSKLAGLPGVNSVDVSLADNSAKVRCDPSLTEATLVAAVQGMNYGASVVADPADEPHDHDHGEHNHSHDHDHAH